MERNVRRGGRLVGVAAIVLSLAACASGGAAKEKQATAPKIEQDWLARVPPEQMAPVEQARADRQSQQDEVNRAAVGRTDAENQLTVARNEKKTTEARIDTAEARLKAAKATGQYTEINQAKADLDRAKLAKQVAEAKVDRDEKAVDLAKAREDLARARLKTAETRVSQAEYQALQATGDSRIARIDPNRYDAALADGQARENQAQSKVQQREQQLQTANTRFQQLGQQLQAAQPSPPRG